MMNFRHPYSNKFLSFFLVFLSHFAPYFNKRVIGLAVEASKGPLGSSFWGQKRVDLASHFEVGFRN